MIHLQGAIFDLDGTLLDSMQYWHSLEDDYLAGFGITRTREERDRYNAMSLLEAAIHYQREYDLSLTPEEIMDGMNRAMERAYFELVQPKPGAIEFLEGLRRKNIPLTIATMTDRYLVEGVLKRLGMLDLFEGIFTCTEVGSGKDVPAVYDAARALLNTPVEQTAVFEDSWFAAQTAGKAGYYVVGVYDANTGEYVDQLKAASHLFIESYEDLRHWIR